MRTITAGRGRQFVTYVSDVDYDYLMQFLWTYAFSHQKGGLVYIRRSVMLGGLKYTLLMHRLIMDRKDEPQPTDEHVTVDHQDGDALNNQRYNLRWATYSEQLEERYRRKVIAPEPLQIPF